MLRRSFVIAGLLLAPGWFAAPALGQAFPDSATELKQRLAAFAAPFIAEESGGAELRRIAAAVVCVVEALDPLPDSVKLEMLQADDFEDTLDLAVVLAEGGGVGRDGDSLERNLEACF